jgi:hypothetical protein
MSVTRPTLIFLPAGVLVGVAGRRAVVVAVRATGDDERGSEHERQDGDRAREWTMHDHGTPLWMLNPRSGASA